MSLPFIILGGGAHATVVISTILSQKREIIGISDADKTKNKLNILGVPFIGTDEDILTYAKTEIFLANGIGGSRDTTRRRTVFQYFEKEGYDFPTIRHPSSITDQGISFGVGCQIFAGSIIQANSLIGKNTIINTGSVVEHDCVIGDHVHIAPGALLAGNITIGNNVHVGVGATIIQGITINDDCVIGAGATVINDVPAGQIVAGVPARQITPGSETN